MVSQHQQSPEIFNLKVGILFDFQNAMNIEITWICLGSALNLLDIGFLDKDLLETDLDLIETDVNSFPVNMLLVAKYKKHRCLKI